MTPEEANGQEPKPVVNVQNVSKTFGTNLVLDQVSLRIDRGKTVCVLGPSGSGKSTLLRCINWLEKPDSGAVFLNGERVGLRPGGVIPMSSRELAAIRARMGMVFQHFNLWPHLTVLQNVIEAPIHVQRRPKNEVIAEALSLLERVGLADKKDMFPAKLSGGQKQRVGIARALAIQPEVLLFDEPTSALDPELVGEVVAVMKTLAAEGRTMLVVTHEMGFAREAADEIVLLDRGRIVEKSVPGAFFTRPETERAQQFLQRYMEASGAQQTLH